MLCFFSPPSFSYGDWILFVSLFCIAFVGAIFFLKKKVEAKEKILAFSSLDILESLCDGAVVVNSHGNILAINEVGEKKLGIKSNALKDSFFHLKGKAAFQILINHSQALLKRSIQTGKTCCFSYLSDSERKKHQELFVKPLRGKEHFILLIKDNLSQHYMQQVGKDFIANASHELRTPITIIRGFAETIQDLPEISEAMVEDFIGKIVRNCHRMNSLVKNLLILTDLDSLPKARLQECDLVALVDSSIQTILSLHKNVEIEAFHNSEIITIPADPDLLEMAIINLLENAIKYSKTLAMISIKIEDLPDQVVLSIADKGMGIPEEELDYIFDRFYTVNKAHSRRLGGAGLGLSIVKAIIEKHEGDISVVSKNEEGTKFSISFQTKESLSL